MSGVRRGVVRLIVPSPDGRRVLAAPNGLAGWRLPSLAVDLPFTEWDARAVEQAAAVVGAPIVPVGVVLPGCWAVTTEGRVPAVGRTWIGLDEVDRLGADASAVRRWADASSPGTPASEDGPG